MDDSRFSAFYDLFQQYQKRVDELPESWEKVNSSTESNTDAFSALVGETVKSVHHASEMVDQLRKATAAQKEFHTAARGAGDTLSTMAKSAASLGSSVFGIGSFLMKMGALGIGAIGAGIFGLDALGRGAVRGQSEARGIGLNQGQLKAFESDFKGYLDPSMLGAVSGAQGSFSGRVYLGQAAGVPYDKASQMGADELSIAIAKRAHDWYVNSPESLRTKEVAASQGFRSEIGLDWQTIKRLGNTSSGELDLAAQQYRKDAGNLNVADPMVAQWRQLTRQLDIAGKSIETVLIKQLARLAPTIGDLTTKLADDLDIFLTTTLTKENVEAFSDTLKDAVTYLGSSEFQQHIKDFGEAIVDVTKLILMVAGWFDSGYKKRKEQEAKGIYGKQDYDAMLREEGGLKGKAVGDLRPTFEENAMRKGALNHLDKKYGLPAGTMWKVYGAESNYGQDLTAYKENKAGAMGPFQSLSGTASQYQVLNRNDFGQESFGMSHYMGDLLKKYKGDLAKAAAAYNWGTGNLDRDIKMHGSNWLQNAPKETQKYVQKIVVDIKTPAGTNFVVNTAALAH